MVMLYKCACVFNEISTIFAYDIFVRKLWEE